ncbi:MAG: glycosyltransferase [Alphaproteobacteria bacterium]|nr:glycosyltransferase [Alphaproteobacteria bacterium]
MNHKLRDLFFAHDGKRADKWEQYIGMYESELASFVARATPVRLLEIGVQNGGSLELWSKYLPPGSVVRGIDIDSRVGELGFDGGGISVAVADATDVARLEEILGNESFDIIIDDGSHVSSHIIESFRILFRRLRPGGKYIIEDLHCSYRASYEGGYQAAQASIEWLKRLVDVLNADHIAETDSVPAGDRDLIASYRTSLARLSFYDSVAVIEKLSVEKTRPYRRAQSGQHAAIMTDEQWLAIQPIGEFEPMLFGHAAARQLEPKLVATAERMQARAQQTERELVEAQAKNDELRGILDACKSAHEQELHTALAEQEAAHKDDLGSVLGALVGARKVVRTGIKIAARQLRRSLPPVNRLVDSIEGARLRRREARLCRPVFDSAWYLRKNPDVAAAGTDPLVHYMTIGWIEGRDPNPLFDTSWYLEQNPDIAAAKVNPLVHYINFGGAEGRDPSPFFDTSWYLLRYPDVEAVGINPMVHYFKHGIGEGRTPHELFGTEWYAQNNPDVAAIDAGSPMQPRAAKGPTESGSPDPNLTYTGQVFKEQQRFAVEEPELRQHVEAMLYRPTFAVVVAGAPGAARERTLASLNRQVYPGWKLHEPTGSPFSIAAAAGSEDTFVVWLAAGDELSPVALYAFASALNADPAIDVAYADEDRLAPDGCRSSPFYKPAWSPDYLESYNYIGHAACFRSSLAAAHAAGAASIYDVVLRVTEHTTRVHHVAGVLYHRCLDNASADPLGSNVAGVAALAGRLQRTGRVGTVTPMAAAADCFDVKVDLTTRPLVSVVIPTAGKVVSIDGRRLDLLANCLESIAGKSTYDRLEFIIVDNGDLGPERTDWLHQRGCKTITFTETRFNIAKKLNLGATIATGDILLLLNDDIEPVSADWIERLLQEFEKPHVGVAGAKLLYPDTMIQHAGVVTARGMPDHVRRFRPRDDVGYFFSTCAVRNFSAVTGACMMTRADLYRRVGGYSESLAISYNDVDYCLKAREAGYTVVYAPGAELTHFESQSRKAVLDKSEHEYFQKRWAPMVTSDPFYNEHCLGVLPATFEIKYTTRRI